MRFSLTNATLTIALIAIALAWWVDRSELKNANRTLVQQEYRTKIEHSLADRKQSARLDAINELAEHADQTSLPALVYAMTDPDVRICSKARAILERLTDQSFREENDSNTIDSIHSEQKQWEEWLITNSPNAHTFIPYTRLKTRNDSANSTEN